MEVEATDSTSDAENPTLGRDGEWIVYSGANPEKAGVWKIRPDGTDATQLVAGTYLQPEVLSGGRYAAASDRGPVAATGRRDHLRSQSVDAVGSQAGRPQLSQNSA